MYLMGSCRGEEKAVNEDNKKSFRGSDQAREGPAAGNTATQEHCRLCGRTAAAMAAAGRGSCISPPFVPGHGPTAPPPPPAWLGSSQFLRCMAHSVCSLVAIRYFSSPSPAGSTGRKYRRLRHKRQAHERRRQPPAPAQQRCGPRPAPTGARYQQRPCCNSKRCANAVLRCAVLRHPPVTLYSSSSNWLSCAHSAITGFCWAGRGGWEAGRLSMRTGYERPPGWPCAAASALSTQSMCGRPPAQGLRHGSIHAWLEDQIRGRAAALACMKKGVCTGWKSRL